MTNRYGEQVLPVEVQLQPFRDHHLNGLGHLFSLLNETAGVVLSQLRLLPQLRVGLGHHVYETLSSVRLSPVSPTLLWFVRHNRRPPGECQRPPGARQEQEKQRCPPRSKPSLGARNAETTTELGLDPSANDDALAESLRGTPQ